MMPPISLIERQCVRCRGAGTIPKRYNDRRFADVQLCPLCSGAGKVKRPCPVCLGLGVIRRRSAVGEERFPCPRCA